MNNDKKYFAILEKTLVKYIVDVDKNIDADINDVPKILKIMFPDNSIQEIDINKINLPRFENSHFINNKFYDPKPFSSWVLENDQWVAPKSYPNDGKLYIWNEDSIQWEEYLESAV